jgi:FtsP/CotA-like multicopper oxidase with cupredoxin domain
MSDDVNRSLRRRDFLKRAGLLGGLVVPAGFASAWAGWLNPSTSAALPGDGILDDFAPSPPVVPFQAPFRTPSVLAPTRADADTDYYEITMRPAAVEILPDRPTTIWGYNGEFPGPTIKARSGRRVVVRQTNDLPDATPSVHLHGGHVEPGSDGYPTDVIARGTAKDYVYPNRQIASTLSYHDHQMHRTGPNVWMGLFGAYLIEDDVEASLNLPSGAYDVPVIIQDRAFRTDGSLRYSPDMMHGALGDVILVNGVAQPRFEVANRRYRLRILNGSNAREYELALSSGQPFVQIATDGGLLPRPVSRTTIPVSPFERVEVIVDFSEVPVGSQVILRNEFDVGRTGQVMLFDVVRREADPSSVPSDLRPLERLDEGSASATRDFTLGMDMMSWVINGQRFDPARVDATPRLGSTEIWRFQNRSGMAHPIHIHLNMFQILDRNGTPPPEAESGWKDTVAVGPDETVRVIVRFTDFAGLYMVHCHNLEHEDDAMMAQFQVMPAAPNLAQ